MRGQECTDPRRIVTFREDQTWYHPLQSVYILQQSMRSIARNKAPGGGPHESTTTANALPELDAGLVKTTQILCIRSGPVRSTVFQSQVHYNQHRCSIDQMLLVLGLPGIPNDGGDDDDEDDELLRSSPSCPWPRQLDNVYTFLPLCT